MRVEYPHSLTKPEVYRILDSYFDTLTQRKIRQGYIDGAERSWNATQDVMVHAFGQTRTGQAVIEEDKVIIKLRLPTIAVLFAGDVKKQITSKLEELL